MNFKNLNASGEFIQSLKKVFIWYAENRSSGYLEGLFEKIKHMLPIIQKSTGDISLITSKDIINYKASLNNKNFWYLGAISTFLRKWYELGIPGVSDDAVVLLKQLRIKGVKKGVAVLTMNPIDGPYTDIEVQSIIDAVNTSYDLGKLSLENYVLVHLMLALGARPSQFASVKV